MDDPPKKAEQSATMSSFTWILEVGRFKDASREIRRDCAVVAHASQVHGCLHRDLTDTFTHPQLFEPLINHFTSVYALLDLGWHLRWILSLYLSPLVGIIIRPLLDVDVVVCDARPTPQILEIERPRATHESIECIQCARPWPSFHDVVGQDLLKAKWCNMRLITSGA